MNVELAMAALEDAKAHPENFDMDVWFSDGGGFTKDREDFSPPCGTTACYAGFVALRVAPVGSMVRACAIIAPGADGIDVEAYATEALDISPAQAATLFYLDGIEQVEGAVRYLADNPDVPSATLWDMFGSDDCSFADDDL